MDLKTVEGLYPSVSSNLTASAKYQKNPLYLQGFLAFSAWTWRVPKKSGYFSRFSYPICSTFLLLFYIFQVFSL